MKRADNKRKAPKIDIAVGDWFDVPLPSGGHAIGLVARLNVKQGTAIAYFFGPRRKSPWTEKQVRRLQPPAAKLVGMVSILGFSHGGWTRVASEEEFDPNHWENPWFLMGAWLGRDFHPGRVKVRYSDDLTKRKAQPATPADMDLPNETLYGYESLQENLDGIL